MTPARSNRLVAIAGGSGSGKGWLVGRLRRLLGDRAGHLALDDFYQDRSHLPPKRRALLNFDRPEAIDWDCARQVLSGIRDGRIVQVPRYDFATHCRQPGREHWTPRPLVLVEGLWLLGSSALDGLFDLTVYLDCPPTLRFERRLARDQAERARGADDIRRQFERTVAPMHDRHVEPQKSRADLVLTQPFRDDEILAFAGRLRALLDLGDPPSVPDGDAFRTELLALLKP